MLELAKVSITAVSSYVGGNHRDRHICFLFNVSFQSKYTSILFCIILDMNWRWSINLQYNTLFYLLYCYTFVLLHLSTKFLSFWMNKFIKIKWPLMILSSCMNRIIFIYLLNIEKYVTILIAGSITLTPIRVSRNVRNTI